MNPTGAARVDDTARRGREQRDGCDCPPWVIRCAHFGDKRVVLIDTDRHHEFDGRCLFNACDDPPFRVSFCNGFVPCNQQQRCHLLKAEVNEIDHILYGMTTANQDAAFAAFFHLEEALLTHDADGRAVQGEPGEEKR